MIALAEVAAAVVAAAERAGERLRAEFFRPEGPRGQRGSAPVDVEIEHALREALQALVPCAFTGEETGASPGLPQPAGERWLWLVDPQDGTSEFLSGRRGSAVSVALLRNGEPVLGVVHSPLSPDRGPDTIAWAEGTPLRRNGAPVGARLSGRALEGETVWATFGAQHRPAGYARAVAPARFVAMPSIAYRLARVAAGDGVAAISTHEVNEYDIAAGAALVRAAGGVVLDAQGREVVFSGAPKALVSGCFAGARAAAEALAGRDWAAALSEPRRTPRVDPGFPRPEQEALLSRAQAALAGALLPDPSAEKARATLAAARALARHGRIPEALRPAAGVPLGIWCAAEGRGSIPEDLPGPTRETARKVRDQVAGREPAGGRESLAPGALLDLMACRPPERPWEEWPDDVLQLAEALVLPARAAAGAT